MKHYLITGTTGLIGSHLLRELSAYARITALVRFKPAQEAPANCSYLECDFNTAWSCNLLPSQIDGIIHLAQSNHFREFPKKSEDIFNVNVGSTAKLLDYASRSGAEVFVYGSSGGVYGYGDCEFTEEDPVGTTSDLGFYLATKLCSEVLCWEYRTHFKINILRFFFVYGRGQRLNMLIPRLVSTIRNNQPVTLHGKNGLQLNPTYVTDAATAICKALSLPGSHKINVAGPTKMNLRSLCEEIGAQLGIQPRFEHVEAQEVPNLTANIEKMSRLLAPPEIDFSTGIRLLLKSQPVPS